MVAGMPKTTSYRARAQADCVVLDAVDDQPCWGVVRFSSHEVYLCEGHRSPPDYRSEPVPPTPEELAQAQALREAEAKTAEKAYEAARWFRPFLTDIDTVPVSQFWASLSPVLLTFLHSALGEALRLSSTNPDPAELAGLQRLGKEATAEVHRRNLSWPDEAYDLDLGGGPFGERALRLYLDLLPDIDVQLLYGTAALVMDFSCLERGVRQVVDHVYRATTARLEQRGINPQFLKST